MSPALDELRREHQVILATLGEAERALASGAPVDAAALVGFLHTYVDERHHAKEELALFPLLREDPFLRDVVETLIGEHDEGRLLLRKLETSLSVSDNDAATATLIRAYAYSLRSHIQKEDTMILEAADSVLDASAARSLADAFARIDTGARGYSSGCPDFT